MDGAERELRLAPAAAGFVLPLSVSTFKVHRTISDVVELLFLPRLYGIELGPGQIATFVVTALVLSFSAVGIPSGGYSFKTLLNVTGDMTAATILARVARVKAGVGRVVAG